MRYNNKYGRKVWERVAWGADEKKDGLTNYWCYEIRKFLNSNFEYKNNEGIVINFKIKNLDKARKRFLINELGKEINVKHFLELFDKFF